MLLAILAICCIFESVKNISQKPPCFGKLCFVLYIFVIILFYYCLLVTPPVSFRSFLTLLPLQPLQPFQSLLPLLSPPLRLRSVRRIVSFYHQKHFNSRSVSTQSSIVYVFLFLFLFIRLITDTTRYATVSRQYFFSCHISFSEIF